MPDDDRPDHHTARGFRNPAGNPHGRPTRRTLWRFLMRRLADRRRPPAVPEGHALAEPEARAGLDRLAGADSLTWLGHASFLIRLAGKTIISDPYLTDWAGPVRGTGPKRLVPAGIGLANLPPIDALILSHNHYDHLDGWAIRAMPGKDRMKVIVPLGLGRYFTRLGYAHVAEVDWYQAVDLGPVAITALPALHWSKRTPFDRNRSLWASFSIRSADHHLWFAGDTGYGPIFEQLGQSHGPFDTVLVPIGAYEPRAIMRAHHTTPEEAVQVARDMGARTMVAMHWGTVVLTDEPPFEPPARFRAAATAAGYDETRAWLMKIGETRPLTSGWPANY